MDVMVFIPLQEEMEYAYQCLIDRGATCEIEFYPEGKSYDFTLELLDRTEIQVGISVIGDMGNLRAATSIVTNLLDQNPQSIFLTGIAGSLNPAEAALGDVVVSTRVKAFYPDKVKKLDEEKEQWFTAPPLADVEGNEAELTGAELIDVDDRQKILDRNFFRYRRDAVWHDRSGRKAASYKKHLDDNKPPALKPVLHSEIDGLAEAFENPEPKIVRGDVFGSDMVIDSQDYIDFIRYRNAIENIDYYAQKSKSATHDRRRWFPDEPTIVDMETYGFLMTLEALMPHLRNFHAFSVRGVSDLAAEKAALDDTTFDKVRTVAVENAIRTVVDMIQIMAPLGKS